MQIEIPEHAQWARVMLAELTRLNSHLVWLGTHAIDIGAMSVFLYCFREREEILRIFEMCSGQRMMTSYIRPGGLALALSSCRHRWRRSILHSSSKDRALSSLRSFVASREARRRTADSILALARLVLPWCGVLSSGSIFAGGNRLR